MPGPETIGLTLSPGSAARVEAVQAGSAAERAGFRAGDELVALKGQPVISEADVAWVLHHTPDAGSLTAGVKRGASEKQLAIELPEGWRMQSDISRRVGTWSMRAMATGGLLLEELSAEECGKHGLRADEMALFVKHVGQYGEHAVAKRAGFQKDDVIVEIDGISRSLSESELIGRLLERHLPGDKVPATVWRRDKRVELSLPMQ